ncbi:MAG: NHLP leader peptide family RiPP precursor [Rhodospirillaceae bacterium]
MTSFHRCSDYDLIIAKVWANRGFKKRLLRDPVGTMALVGVTPPPGVTIKVIADTPETCSLVLPPPPPEGGSVAEQLAKVAGGVPRAAILLSGFDRIMIRAWGDPDFKRRLLDNPAEAFEILDITPPDGITFTVVEDTPELNHLVLPPPPPKEIEFSEEAGYRVNHLMRWLALISGPFAS